MPVQLLNLLKRDHADLEVGLTELLHVADTGARLRTVLDGVRLGMSAHSEAEDIVLYPVFARFDSRPTLRRMVEQAREAHAEQESTLALVVTTPFHTAGWMARVERLRDMVHRHSHEEETQLIPALAEVAPAELLQSLAGAYATERLRQLAMLQPSAPANIYPMSARP